MAAKSVIYINSDTVAEMTLTDPASNDDPILSADLKGTLKDAEDDSATDISGELTWSHVAAGLYRVTLEDTLTLTDGVTYWFHLVMTTPKDAEWRIAMQAQWNNG